MIYLFFQDENVLQTARAQICSADVAYSFDRITDKKI
jgi:hypothetical protein